MDDIVKRIKTFDPKAFLDALVRFLVKNRLPFTFVDIKDFQDVLYGAQLATSRVQIELPSNDTIAARIQEKYSDMQGDVVRMLAGMNKVSFTVGGWTSPFQDDFLGVTAHWIDQEWKQREL
ncbi:hypothetical protein BGX26_006927, partial [Mortierella sp. AD094]